MVALSEPDRVNLDVLSMATEHPGPTSIMEDELYGEPVLLHHNEIPILPWLFAVSSLSIHARVHLTGAAGVIRAHS